MNIIEFMQTEDVELIEVKNLVKRYGDFEAVRGVSFEIKKGMIYGFLGPNGAGKSTTMNIITGCLAATEGEVTVNGCDIYEDPIGAKSAIGYLPEIPPLYTDMTAEEYLAFVGEAKGMSGDKLYREVDRVIAKTGLTSYSTKLIKNLSKGYKQRVGIAQAIIGNPEIIILDEPTVGLDPRQIIEIRELIRELGRESTVILSSHILTEIAEVCDYVIIISHGQVVASDTIDNLTKKYEGKNYVDITTRGDEERIKRLISSIDGVIDIECDTVENTLHVRIATESGRDIREELFFRFADAKTPILSMNYEEVTLEKVFLELTGESNGKTSIVKNDAHMTAEEQFAEKALENMKNRAEADTVPTEESEEKTEPVRETHEKKKSGHDDDDYKPLFGGN